MQLAWIKQEVGRVKLLCLFKQAEPQRAECTPVGAAKSALALTDAANLATEPAWRSNVDRWTGIEHLNQPMMASTIPGCL